MTSGNLSEIRQFNEHARQALDKIKRQQAASATSIQASHIPQQSTRKITLTQHLALAEEHVARGERLVARQRETVDEFERDGHAFAPNAVALLAQFEEVQALHIADRDRLLKELSELK